MPVQLGGTGGMAESTINTPGSTGGDPWRSGELGNLTDDNIGTLTSAGGARSLGKIGAVLRRKDRLQVFGIDCTGPYGDGILFKGGEWAPGGEYVQRLRVKNVSPKLKKLKYRLPTTKYFSMAFPEIISLSPGTEKEIDVVFRPMSSEVYDDVILFKVLDGPNAGGFNVPVRALLPTLQVSIPEGLDFGYCQADDVSKRVFYVKNTGEVPAPFSWEIPPPFVMSPSEGEVAVGESFAVTCSLRPANASVFVSQAVLMVGQGVNAIKPSPLLEIKISAVGKYCYVVPSDNEIDFGSQTIFSGGASSSVGDQRASCRKDFTLRNQSVVPAAFTIRRLEGDRDPAFTVHPSAGVIAPEDEMIITVTYNPISTGTFSRDHYEIVAVGGNKVTVGIQGRAVGCSVRIEKKEDPFARGYGVPDSINFREVKVGVMTSRVIFLYNEATEPCRFCFAVQGDSSIFRFSRTRGIIPSAGSEHPGEAQVTLTFTPNMPTNYYRRIFCLLENQQPLVMDSMGTGYLVAKGEVQEQRPAPLRHAHVQAFRNRANVGLGRCSPDDLETLLEQEGISDLFARVGPQGTGALQKCTISKPLTRSGEATRLQTATAFEFFVDPSDPRHNDVYLDCSSIDLGYTSGGGHETVTLNNNTHTEVHVIWNLKGLGGGEPGDGGLEVSPLETEIPAGGSMPFQVGLSASKGNCYFAEEAEAFVSPKNQRTFRMVKDPLQQPPWCLPLRVLGHSFVGEQFLAKVALSTQHTGQRLYFPACHIGDTVYQTIRLSNQGNIPAHFSFQPDPSGLFDIKPSVGLIPAGDFQLCLLRFTPPGPGNYRHSLECVLNNDPGGTQAVELFGQGTVPALRAICMGSEGSDGGAVVEMDGSSNWGSDVGADRDGRPTMYMRPTCVGLASFGSVKIKNSSRIPAIFVVEPPKASAGVFHVSPLVGFLLGNQTETVRIAFAPRETKGYRFKLPIKVRSILGEAPTLTDCRQLGEAVPAVLTPGTSMSVVGQGRKGAVAFHPEFLTFSVRLVNTPESKVLVLENCSECDVRYKLFYIANKEPSSRHRPTSDSSRSNSGDDDHETAQPLRMLPKENGEAKGQGPDKTSPLFLDKPQGVLPARSRSRTIATFRPVKDGEYGFSILCQVSTVGEDTDDGVLFAVKADMEGQGHKARAAEAVLEATGMMGERGGDPGADNGFMPLRCGVSGRASFPTVVFRDVRMTRMKGGDMLGASPRNLWSALSLSRINAMLSKPLSEEEVRFNQESSPDTSQLPRFDIPFVPSVIGEGPVIISLQVCNPGFLPTAVTVNLPNAKPVEMETWANEGEPTAEELRQNDVIDRLKAFTMIPPPGTVVEVSAGETQPLRLAYSADSLTYGGVHDLPVLVSTIAPATAESEPPTVRIKEGHQFWLDLKGTTLQPQTPLLYVPTGLTREYGLEPVAVGTPLNEAPLQTTEILNVGEAGVWYVVDDDTIGDTNDAQGYGVPVFRLEKSSGTISGGGSAFLRWRFLPVETKEYVLKVIIRTDVEFEEHAEGQSLEITLRGNGYDPRTHDPYRNELPRVDLGLVHPIHQLEVPPGQPCALGVERLRLGRLPQGAVFSRVLSIRNCLSTETVEFSWDPLDSSLDAPLLSSGILSIRPLAGRIEAGQSLLLQLTISANCGPRVFGQRPVQCLVRTVPPVEIIRSRKAKSRLESRMEEERQARGKLPGPRVPVVSRPTAARTNHMTERARVIAAGDSGIAAEGGHLLVPHYPTSTIASPVPYVLAEALAERAQIEPPLDGLGLDAISRRSSAADGGSGTSNFKRGTPGNSDDQNPGYGAMTPGGSQGTASYCTSSHGQSDGYRWRGNDRPSTTTGSSCLLCLEIEGEVVCMDTYLTLFGKRDLFNEKENIDKQAVYGENANGTFLVPKPSKYVPDWVAFGAEEPENRGDNEGGEDNDQRNLIQRHKLLKRASEDHLAGSVASRILKRMVGDLITTAEVKSCLESLPSKGRVSSFRDIQRMPPLPDRLAMALSSYLPTPHPWIPPPPPTAATAAVETIVSTSLAMTRINRNTLVPKRSLVDAFRAAACQQGRRRVGAVACAGEGSMKNARGASGNSGGLMLKKTTLASLTRAVEACPGSTVTLEDLLCHLDNATVKSLEKWLETRTLPSVMSRESATMTERSSTDTGQIAAETVSHGIFHSDDTKIEEGSGTSIEGDDSAVNVDAGKAALAIQSQVRRRQALHTAEDAAELKLLKLADEALNDPNTQKTVAATLEGTFYNLMQDAFDGQFNLFKLPRRFAIRQRKSASKTGTSSASRKGTRDGCVPTEKSPPHGQYALLG